MNFLKALCVLVVVPFIRTFPNGDRYGPSFAGNIATEYMKWTPLVVSGIDPGSVRYTQKPWICPNGDQFLIGGEITSQYMSGTFENSNSGYSFYGTIYKTGKSYGTLTYKDRRKIDGSDGFVVKLTADKNFCLGSGTECFNLSDIISALEDKEKKGNPTLWSKFFNIVKISKRSII